MITPYPRGHAGAHTHDIGLIMQPDQSASTCDRSRIRIRLTICCMPSSDLFHHASLRGTLFRSVSPFFLVS